MKLKNLRIKVRIKLIIDHSGLFILIYVSGNCSTICIVFNCLSLLDDYCKCSHEIMTSILRQEIWNEWSSGSGVWDCILCVNSRQYHLANSKEHELVNLGRVLMASFPNDLIFGVRILFIITQPVVIAMHCWSITLLLSQCKPVEINPDLDIIIPIAFIWQ